MHLWCLTSTRGPLTPPVLCDQAHNIRRNTALHFAYERNNTAVVDFLLAHGALASESKRNSLGLLPKQLRPTVSSVSLPIKQYIQDTLPLRAQGNGPELRTAVSNQTRECARGQWPWCRPFLCSCWCCWKHGAWVGRVSWCLRLRLRLLSPRLYHSRGSARVCWPVCCCRCLDRCSDAVYPRVALCRVTRLL